MFGGDVRMEGDGRDVENEVRYNGMEGVDGGEDGRGGSVDSFEMYGNE